jgi:sulfur carrier protein
MTMRIVLNGRPQQTGATMSLAQAVALLTTAPSGVAAAVNGEVVRRSAWDSTPLSEGDQVEVLTAVQGG